MTPPVALTIAGSDSGGGAGIQADLRTFAALGVFGTTAVTAITAQNSVEVRAVRPLTPDDVASQVEAVLDDLPVAAVKTGMLAEAAIVELVGELAACGRLPNLVVDPVLVASSGARLATAATVDVYLSDLVPHAVVFTPNLPEAGTLLGIDLLTLADQRYAARRLGEITAGVIVVKGGHAVMDTSGEVIDVIWDGAELRESRRPRVETTNTHGSGCTFAAAIAAGLACSLGVGDAIEAAGEFVHAAIEHGAAWHLGVGRGPLDHFGWSTGQEDRSTGVHRKRPPPAHRTA